jgi:hypothetical protein
LPITSRCDRHNNIKTAMLDINLITIKTLLHSFKSKASTCLAVILFGALAIPALAQGTPPAASSNCTVTAMNRTAPLQGDYGFTIYNIPGAAAFLGPGTPTPAAPFRVRAACSDGTVGETSLAFPEFGSTVVYTGELFWRPATPIPVALALTAAKNKLKAGESTQLSTSGILVDGQTADLTARTKGTAYLSSNPLILRSDENGLTSVFADFASGSSARVIVTALNEGVAGSTLLQLGPRGRLTGKILYADGLTPVAGALVTVIRNQPREALGTVSTDASGNFAMEDVSAGSFSVSVTEPVTGDRGTGFGSIATDGEVGTTDIKLNGQGTITVNVQNASGGPVSGASVTFTSLGAFRDFRTVQTNAAGQVVLDRAMAGPFTVSTRDSASNLVGAANGTLLVGGSLTFTLKLQPVGNISGMVLASDASTVQADVQVRVVSAVRGIMSQVVTAEDGKFRFDSLPLSDGPYTLDAIQNGRLKARVPQLILSSSGQELVKNVVFGQSGQITGIVTRAGGTVVEGATVSVQSQVGERFTFSTKTNAEGRYTIAGVALGAFGLTASAGAGETASAGGNVVSDGESVTLNLLLASNGIVGTVFGRDGVTPVSANVTVTLQPGGQTTQTNAQGQYGFNITQTNTYTLEASDANGNRGRSSIVLTAINPGDPKTVNVVFLGRGTVQGVVRDPSGNIQAGIPVTFTSNSVFGGSANVVTDAQGQYSTAGQFVGGFSVTARNTSTNLAGTGTGQIAVDGEVVSINVTLAASGSVSGTVFKADNTTPVANATVSLQGTSVYYPTLNTVTDAAGNYSFLAVPLSNFNVSVTNLTDQDRGQASSRLTTVNEARTLNIRLLGKGAVRVNAQDSAGQPVPAVVLQLSSQSVYGGYFSATTGADGSALISGVFNGDFSVTASKGTGATRLNGSASGTVSNSATIVLPITVTNKPVGTLTGLVTKNLAADPQTGVEVRLQNNNTGAVRTVLSDAQGRYSFEQVEVNVPHRITAVVSAQVRARSDVTLTTADETVTRNLTLLGVGTVSGLITNATGQVQAGVYVTLTNSDPTYGGTWYFTTLADGRYSFANVPAGNFSIRARNANNTLQAQDSGSVRFDADAVTRDLTLVDSAVNMPINRYDANGMVFDLQGDGSIASGSSSVFRGNGTSDTRASRLDIVVNGISVPFLNGDGSIGRVTQGGQLLEVDELNQASGLNVTRRVYVPNTGYFSRYLEVLENKTANPITVGVKISSNFAQGQVGARVVDTSSNDTVLDVSNDASRDRWVIVDDDSDSDPFISGSQPAVALVFDGLNADAKVAAAEVTALGVVAKVSWQWKDVVVPAGTSAAFMHFTVQQLGRTPARIAAERLNQLPPEALEGLTPEERAIIKNFKVPADGVSLLTALPSVENSKITGTVYAGDGSTVIPNAQIKIQSQHPLYGRVFTATADALGKYSLSSPSTLGQGSAALVQDNFKASAVYPVTQATSAIAVGQFTTGQSATVQDIIFTGAGTLKGNVKRHAGAVVGSGTATIPYQFPSGYTSYLSSQIRADGSYNFTGIVPNSYLVSVSQTHPQGQPIKGVATRPVEVGASLATVMDVVMEESGEVAGKILSATGEPIVGASVQLDPSPYYGPYRSTTSDTGGNYRFTDVVVGVHAVQATSTTGLSVSGNTTVTKDTQSAVNLQLAGLGRLIVQVKYQRGVAAIGAMVTANNSTKYTNAAGEVSFDVPLAVPVSIVTQHPDNYSYYYPLQATDGVTITDSSSNVTRVLTLPAAGTITGTLYKNDGVTPVPYKYVYIRNVANNNSGTYAYTDINGSYRFNGLALAAYNLTATDSANFEFADADATVSTDGQEVVTDLKFAENQIALPSNLYDANGFVFDVASAGSFTGRNNLSYNSGGVKLAINGQAFTGEANATLEAGRRQFAISQPTPIAGLNVTRKIYVPKGAYFARYLEILENPSNAPITASIELKSGFYAGTTGVIETSSGGASIKATGIDRDTWAVIDDTQDSDPFITGSPPATAFIMSAAGANQTDQFEFNTVSSNYYQNKALSAGWGSVVVPANGRVTLMHFVSQQVNRAGAKAAAQRLQQLPPEAIAALTIAEVNSIANFTLPANGISSIPALPSLLGSISGTVFEGNQTTTVSNAYATVRSKHPLFNRTYMSQYYCVMPANSASLLSNASGVYSINGQVQDTNSIPIATDSPVEIGIANGECAPAGHPITGITAPAATVGFAAGQITIAQDIVFPSGILTGTVVGPTDYGVGSGNVRVDGLPRGTAYVQIASDGTYVFPGLPAGNVTLNASVPHNQGTSLSGQRLGSPVTLGQVTVTDIEIQATGSVQGAVLTANGEAAIGVNMSLRNSSNSLYRNTKTDSLGRFNLSAVPVGSYTLSVTDTRTSAVTTAQVSVTRNQITIQNMILVGAGSVQLTVKYARGTAAINSDVYLQSQAVGAYNIYQARTDAQGKINIVVPVGDYLIRANHPSDYYSYRSITGTISTNNEVQDKTIVLGASAAVRVLLLDADANNAPVIGAEVTYKDSYCPTGCYAGVTDGSGRLTYNTMREGNFSLTLRTPQGRIVQTNGTVDASNDGQVIEKTLVVTAAKERSGELTFTAERQIYSIQANANDVISLTVRGVPVNGGAASYLTRVEIFDTNNVVVASGRGYSVENSYQQINQLGNLQSYTAPISGNYSIAVSPYYYNNASQYLGGYSLAVTKNGLSQDILNYQDGGIVSGTLTKGSGAAVVGDWVEITSSSAPNLRVRSQTNVNGGFTFNGVPLGNFSLATYDGITKQMLTLADGSTTTNGTLDNKGQSIVRDLQLAKKTNLQIKVNVAGGLSTTTNMYVRVATTNDYRNYGPLVFQNGQQISDPITAVFSGDQALVSVTHPQDAAIVSTQTVGAQDGETVNVNLTLAAASLSGNVVTTAGVAVPNAYIEVFSNSNNYITSTYSDAAGRYEFLVLAASQELIIKVRDPITSVFSVVRLMLSPGESATRNIEIQGTGSIHGVLSRSSGGGIASTYVTASYVYDEVNNYSTSASGYTNEAGEYSIANLPVGRLINVSATIDTGFRSNTVDGTVTLSAAGQDALLNLTANITGGSLVIQTVGTDNEAIESFLSYLQVQAANGESAYKYYVTTGAANSVVFDGVPFGNATISGYLGYGIPLSANINIVDGQQAVAVFRIPVIKGVVKTFEGVTITNPSVQIIGSDGATRYAEYVSSEPAPVPVSAMSSTLSVRSQSTSSSSSVAGTYKVYGVPAGEYTLTAEAAGSGLSKTITGNFVNLDEPLVADVTLPPAATVSGTFRNKANLPVPYATVYVRSSGLDLDRYAYTDENGIYRVDQLALGNITVLGKENQTGLIATGTGILSSSASIVNIDIKTDNSLRVTGLVTDNGVPVQGASVYLKSVYAYGAFGVVSQYATTDTSGKYEFLNAPAGDFRIQATNYSKVGVSQVITGAADSIKTVDIALGNAVLLSHVLTGSDSSQFQISGSGNLIYTAYGQRGYSYYGGQNLNVSNLPYPYQDFAFIDTLNGPREIVFLPVKLSALNTTRRIFVPETGGFVRYVDSFKNLSTVDVSVQVALTSNPYAQSVLVSPVQSSGRYAILARFNSDSIIGEVFAGNNSSVIVNSNFLPESPTTNTWNITIPAGETVSLMHFVILRNSTDSAGAQAQAESLSNLTQPGMLDGLSSSDKFSIKNFSITP